MGNENDSIITRFFNSIWNFIKWIFIILGGTILILIIIQLIIKNDNPINIESMIYNLFKRNTITLVS
jgi:hypothetical protein